MLPTSGSVLGFLLFPAHLALNRNWLKNLSRGRYPAYRTVQTVLAALCLLAMLSLMASGILLSEVLFPGVRVRGWTETAHGLYRLSHLVGHCRLAGGRLREGQQFHWKNRDPLCHLLFLRAGG